MTKLISMFSVMYYKGYIGKMNTLLNFKNINTNTLFDDLDIFSKLKFYFNFISKYIYEYLGKNQYENLYIIYTLLSNFINIKD